MSQEIAMLNKILESSEMGRDGIMQIIRTTSDSAFRSLLENQLTEYQNVYNTADNMLKADGRAPEGGNLFAKATASMSTSIKSMMDDSTPHLAEMLVQGTTMGVTTMTREINEYCGKDKKVLGLAQQLLRTQENNISELKKFL